MTHWSIPTTLEQAEVGGTFYVNACGSLATAPRAKTEDPKKVTCKLCKEAYKMPRSRQSIAAKVWLQIEAAKQSDFLVKVCCNACDHELHAYDLGTNHTFQDLRTIVAFLEHCAYVHMGGSEYVVYVEQSPVSVYELNRAMGKLPMTQHEEDWRLSHALGVKEEVLHG